MSAFSFEHGVFKTLARLSPATSLVHVGDASRVQIQTYAPLHVRRIFRFRKADAPSPSASALTSADGPELIDIDAVLADKSDTASFYTANLAKESGLIDPSLLTSIWRNLSTLDTDEVETTTLDAALASKDATPNWLFVDCFPAAPVLRGAAEVLSSVDAVIARCLSDEVGGSDLSDARRSVVAGVLKDAGFVELEDLPGTHPSIRYTVHARSIVTERVRAAALEADKDELNTAIAALRAEHALVETKLRNDIAALRAEHADVETKLKNDIAAVEEALSATQREVQEAEQRADDAAKENDQVEKKRILAENNLKNLQDRYSALADTNEGLSAQLNDVRAKLEAAIRLLGEELKS